MKKLWLKKVRYEKSYEFVSLNWRKENCDFELKNEKAYNFLRFPILFSQIP